MDVSFHVKLKKTLIVTTLRDAMPQKLAVQSYELYMHRWFAGRKDNQYKTGYGNIYTVNLSCAVIVIVITDVMYFLF